MTNWLKRGFLALAPKRRPPGKKCRGQTLFILAWPIVWHRRQGFKFTTELTRWRQIVEIQSITYSVTLWAQTRMYFNYPLSLYVIGKGYEYSLMC